MTTTNCNIRFMENNFAALTGGQITASSALSSFPVTNAVDSFRSKVYKASGHFEITASNNLIYINDGANKTVTVTAADYTTPAGLATAMQTALNAASSNWTVSYDSSGATYKFTIANSGSVTLRLTQTTNAIWDTIGFTTSSDLVGTTQTADEQRNHTDEYIIFDLGAESPVDFAAVIGPLDENFSLSTTATIKLQANNLNVWSAPPFDHTLTRTDDGIYKFFDDVSDTRYRYWRFYYEDIYNAAGPEGISIGNIYLGDYVTFTSKNVSNGFGFETVDPSERVTSDNGTIYFDEKTNYFSLDGLKMGLIDLATRDSLLQIYRKVKTTTPFYVSLDPRLSISTDIEDFTKYVIFDGQPSYAHVIYDTFNMNFKLREVL